MTGTVRHDVIRNGTIIYSWGSDNSKTSHTDAGVTWGTTYTYLLRIIRADGSTKETNTVYVTTPVAGFPFNVVLIITDDQRWDTLQYMPNVQSLLVQSGVTFTNAFAASPQCCPSRSNILSGLHSHNHGVLSNRLGARYFDDRTTLATALQGARYRTALIGKYLNGYAPADCAKIYGQCFVNPSGVHPWPYQPPGWNDWHAFRKEGYWNYSLVENGSEVFYGTAPEDYSTRKFQTLALDFIATTPVGQPFFLMLTPHAPHRPADFESQDNGRYSDIAPWGPPSYNEADVSDKPAWVQSLPLMDGATSANLDWLRQKQLQSLQSVDRMVKAVYDAVGARGELEKTVFIFTSDNGQAWGEHRWNAKMCPYDECARVPFVVRAPGIVARSDPHMISLIDLSPSIAAWMGARHPKVNGMSFAKLVTNKDVAWRDAVLIEMLDGESTQQLWIHSAIRTQQYLYAEYQNGDRELYVVGSDPYFLTNRVNFPEYAGVVGTLQSRLGVLRKE